MATRFWPGIALLALLQSGCVAYTQSQPALEGRLVDSSGKPITAATITLKSYRPGASTVTDSKGFFAFADEHEWSFFLPVGPIDKINLSRLLISAQGQQYDVLLSYGLSGPYGSRPAGGGGRRKGVYCVRYLKRNCQRIKRAQRRISASGCRIKKYRHPARLSESVEISPALRPG